MTVTVGEILLVGEVLASIKYRHEIGISRESADNLSSCGSSTDLESLAWVCGSGVVRLCQTFGHRWHPA